jgi:hypothetical protein
MPLNSSGQLSLGGSVTGESITLQLGLSPTAQVSLNDAAVRALAGIPEGPIRLPIDFWGKPAGSPSTDKGLFAFGSRGATNLPQYTNVVNQVSNLGFISTDVTVNVAALGNCSALVYGGDKGIIKFATRVIVTPGPVYRTVYTSNQLLVSNTGVVTADAAVLGTARTGVFACSYGVGLGSFIFGGNVFGGMNIRNDVSDTGIVSTDSSAPGSARFGGASVNFGVGQSLMAYGEDPPGGSGPTIYPLISNILSDTGVISTDITILEPARSGCTGASYGNGKGIIAYGNGAGTTTVSFSNLVSETGVIASSIALVGTLRTGAGGCSFGGDKAMFGYGGVSQGSGNFTVYNMTNRVSNTGVISSDAVGIGTARVGVAGCGYGLAP